MRVPEVKRERRGGRDIKSMTHALNIRMQIGGAHSPKEEDIFDFPHRHICNLKKMAQKRAAVNPARVLARVPFKSKREPLWRRRAQIKSTKRDCEKQSGVKIMYFFAPERLKKRRALPGI